MKRKIKKYKFSLIIPICIAVLFAIFFDYSSTPQAGDLLSYPKFHAFDSSGDPLSGGKLHTYIAGTSTNKASYSEKTCTTANTNPVVLDSNGEADVYLCGTYKLVLKDSADVTLWTLDNIDGGTASFDDFRYPDSNAADQGVTGDSNTIKYYVDDIGATKTATIYLRHNSGSDTTTYTLSTDETITSNITLEFSPGALLSIDSGKTLTVDGSVIASSAQQIKSGAGTIKGNTRVSYVYPHWVGAVGDGVTNDRAALEEAEIWATDASIPLFIPGGFTFLTSSGLTTSASIHGTGTIDSDDTTGDHTINVDADGLTIKDITVLGGAGGSGIYIDQANIIVENVRISGTFNSGIGVYHSGATNIILRGNIISNATSTTGDGILVFNGAERVTITGNNIYDVTRIGIAIDTDNVDIIVSDNIIKYAHDQSGGNINAGIWLEHNYNVLVSGNIIDDTNTYGIYVLGLGTADNQHIITGNRVNSSTTAVYLNGHNNFTKHTVTDNIITNYTSGIVLKSGDSFIIANNHFGPVTYATADMAAIILDNVSAGQPSQLIIDGNTKEANTYTHADSADLLFIDSTSRVLYTEISNMSNWRINGRGNNVIERLKIANSYLTLSGSGQTNFPRTIEMHITNSTFALSSDFAIGDLSNDISISNSTFRGNYSLVLRGNATRNQHYKFSNNFFNLTDIDIVATWIFLELSNNTFDGYDTFAVRGTTLAVTKFYLYGRGNTFINAASGDTPFQKSTNWTTKSLLHDNVYDTTDLTNESIDSDNDNFKM